MLSGRILGCTGHDRVRRVEMAICKFICELADAIVIEPQYAARLAADLIRTARRRERESHRRRELRGRPSRGPTFVSSCSDRVGTQPSRTMCGYSIQ